MEAKIIAICNNKGGTSKTATTINLGASLAEMGHKTLLIDYDPQANLTAALRVQGTPIYYTIKDKAEIKPAEIAPNLYAVPSSMELAAAETEFNNNAERNYLLADCLEPLRGAYDYIYRIKRGGRRNYSNDGGIFTRPGNRAIITDNRDVAPEDQHQVRRYGRFDSEVRQTKDVAP